MADSRRNRLSWEFAPSLYPFQTPSRESDTSRSRIMELTGGEIVAEHLIREDVPYLIGIPGHGCMALLDAFRRRRDQITTLQVRHEQSAVHMADGYYRVARKPLAVYSSIGPGAMNLAVGLGTAYVDSTAVLALTGQTHTHMFGK